ncbi:hypothetical protein ACLOJK_037919 [Asimina triloba]
MIDGEHNTVHPNPGTARSHRPFRPSTVPLCPATADPPPSAMPDPAASHNTTRPSPLPSDHGQHPFSATAHDPSLSDPCHPTLSSSRTISSSHFPHSTPQRHHGQPCQQLMRRRPALQQAKPICIWPPCSHVTPSSIIRPHPKPWPTSQPPFHQLADRSSSSRPSPPKFDGHD